MKVWVIPIKPNIPSSRETPPPRRMGTFRSSPVCAGSILQSTAFQMFRNYCLLAIMSVAQMLFVTICCTEWSKIAAAPDEFWMFVLRHMVRDSKEVNDYQHVISSILYRNTQTNQAIKAVLVKSEILTLHNWKVNIIVTNLSCREWKKGAYAWATSIKK